MPQPKLSTDLSPWKWKPGFCPNPAGRPVHTLTRKLIELSHEAIETERGKVEWLEILARMLQRLCLDDAAPVPLRMLALKLVLERIDPVQPATPQHVQNVLVNTPGVSALALRICEAGEEGLPSVKSVLKHLKQLRPNPAIVATQDGNGRDGPTD